MWQVTSDFWSADFTNNFDKSWYYITLDKSN